MGWIGSLGELHHTLRMFGADRDETDRILVTGSITAYLGIDRGDATEVVIGDDATYYVDGHPRSIVAALQATSYGLQVTVIG